jgi:hypothetical protein
MRQPRAWWRVWLALLMIAGLLLSACDLLPQAATPTPVSAVPTPADIGNAPQGTAPGGERRHHPR